MQQVVQSIFPGLVDSSKKERKAAVKVLLEHVESSAFHRFLDSQRPPPDRSISYPPNQDDAHSTAWCCWSGLALALLKCLHNEVISSNKKIDDSFAKCLRLLCGAACHHSRRGCLARAARRIFAHVADGISEFGLSSTTGEQYAQTLDKLVSSPTYGPLCLATDLEALCTALTEACTAEVSNGGAGAHNSALAKQLKRLEKLLCVCNATLPPAASRQLAKFFGTLFGKISGRHGELGLAKSAVACLTYFFMHHGRDMYSQLPQVYQDAAVFTRLLWHGGQQSVGSELGGKTRLACGLLSVLALRFDAVHSSSELEEIHGLACSEIAQLPGPLSCPSSSFESLSATVRPHLSAPAALLVRVLALQFLRQHQRHGNKPVRLPEGGCADQPNGSGATQRTQHGAAKGNVSWRKSKRRSEADDDGAGKRRRGPTVLQRLCDQLCSPNGSDQFRDCSLWMCTAAYIAWQLAPQLSAGDLGALAAAVAQGCSALVGLAAAGSDDLGADCALGWGLLALEGIATAAWGVPRHQRKLYPSPPESSPRPAHALAAQVDWHDIARIADAVTERGAKRLSEGQATGGAQIACSRALHLRRALMAHHLEALPLEEAGVWDAVGDLIGMGVNGPPLAQQPSEPQRPASGRVLVLDGARRQPAASLTAEQDVFAAAVQLQAARLRALHLLDASLQKLLVEFSAAIVASPLPALLSIECLFGVFGLSQPFSMQQNAPLCTDPGDVRFIELCSYGQARPYALECGWRDNGQLGAADLDAQSKTGFRNASGAWTTADDSIEVADALVPNAATTTHRAHVSAWLAHHAHATPAGSMPNLPRLMEDAAPAFQALADQLASAASDTAAPLRATHVGASALLRAAALMAAVLAGMAEAAAFHHRSMLPDDVCALFTSGSKVHIALLKALDALLNASGAAAAPICAALSRLLTKSFSAPPREQRATFAFTQSQGTQLPAAHATSAVQSASQPRYSDAPMEADSVPPDAKDSPAVLSVAMLQTLQVLTCALRAVKDYGWLSLECTSELFASCADQCAQQLQSLYDGYQSGPGEVRKDDADDEWGLGSKRRKAGDIGNAAGHGVQCSLAHSRMMACLIAVAHVEPVVANRALNRAINALEDGGDMVDDAAGTEPRTLPLGWATVLTKAAFVIADLEGIAQAWNDAVALLDMPNIGIFYHITSSLETCHAWLALTDGVSRAIDRSSHDDPGPLASQSATVSRNNLASLLVELLLPSIMKRGQTVGKAALATVALNDFEAVLAATPWQLRARHAASVASALYACSAALQSGAETDVTCALNQAREWLLVGLRDTSSCVRLACASHLEAVFRSPYDSDPLVTTATCLALPGLLAMLAESAGESPARPTSGAKSLHKAALDACIGLEAAGLSLPERLDSGIAALTSLLRLSRDSAGQGRAVAALLSALAAVEDVHNARKKQLGDFDVFTHCWLTAKAALEAATAQVGYASWSHAMAQIAPALAAAWVTTGGTITDLASCAHLLDMPQNAVPVDAEGWCALPQSGLPHAVHSSSVLPENDVPMLEAASADPAGHAVSTALLTDAQLFAGGVGGLADPGNTAFTAVLSSAHLKATLPQQVSSQDAHAEELLQEVRDGKKGLKPLLPMLVALYRVLQITAGDVAHDAAISHYFPVPLHGGSAEDAIAAFAAQQLEHLATLFGVAERDLQELAMASSAAYMLPAAANASLSSSASAVLNSFFARGASQQGQSRLWGHHRLCIMLNALLLARPISTAPDVPPQSLLSAALVLWPVGSVSVSVSTAAKGSLQLPSTVAAPNFSQREQVAHLALALERHVCGQRDPVHMLQGLEAAAALVDVAAALSEPSKESKARSSCELPACGGPVQLAALLRLVTHCLAHASGSPDMTEQHLLVLQAALTLLPKTVAALSNADAAPLLCQCLHEVHSVLCAATAAQGQALPEALSAVTQTVRDSQGLVPLAGLDDVHWASRYSTRGQLVLRSCAVALVDACAACMREAICKAACDMEPDLPQPMVLWAMPGLMAVPSAAGMSSATVDSLLQLSNPANIPPKLDPGILTLNALYTFAACAARLTHAARSAACRRLCRFLAALPADVQSFTDSEALSVLGALSRAAQDTGAACVADVLAAVLERCPRVEAAAAAAAPARNRVHSASSVAQLMLNLQMADDGAAQIPQGHGGGLSVEDTRVFLHANVLAQLSSLLCGDAASPVMVHAALSAGLALLQCPGGCKGVAHLTSYLQRSAVQACSPGANTHGLPEAAALVALQQLADGQRGSDSTCNVVQPVQANLADAAALQRPISGNAWACALVAALLQRPPLAHSTLACLARTAAHSASLSKAMLPLLCVVVATSWQDAAGYGSAICEQLTELACIHVFPATAAAAAAIQHGKRPDTADSLDVTSGRLQAIELLLQCLSVLRSCSVAARLTKGLTTDYSKSKGGTPDEVEQARHVVSWPMEYWLDLDCLQVAAAAELVGRHEEALQYVELWSADVTQSARLPDAAEAIASAERRGVVDAQSASAHGQAAAGLDLSPEEVVLWGAYGALGDPDLSSGVAAIPKEPFMLMLAEQEGHWLNALTLRSNHVGLGGQGCTTRADDGITHSLRRLGCGSLAPQPEERTGSGSVTQQSAQHAAAAQEMATWRHAEATSSSDIAALALRCTQEGATDLASSMQAARRQVARTVATAQSGRHAAVQAAQVDLQILRAVQQTLDALALGPEHRQAVPAQWHELSEGARLECSASQVESLQCVRIDVLRNTGASAAACLDAMTAHAGALRARGDVHAALGAVLHAQAFVRAAGAELSGAAPWWRLEEARVLWDLRQQRQAIKLLDLIIDSGGAAQAADSSKLRRSEALCLRGHWKAAHHSDTADNVRRDFEQAIKLSSKVPGPEASALTGRSHFELARFSDQALQAELALDASEVCVKERKAYEEGNPAQIEMARAEIRKFPASQRNRDNLQYSNLCTLINSLTRKQPQIKETLKDRDRRILDFQKVTLQAYCGALRHCDAYDLLAMLRLLQLWLSRPGDASISELLSTGLQAIPSHKLLDLAYQMASRLGGGSKEQAAFQELLSRLLTRLATDHPHHVLLHLFSLRAQQGADKGKAADAIIKAVASHDVSLKAIVTELESVVDAYTTIATKKLKPVEFASATIATIAPQAMRMIAGKRHVPVLSVSVPKRPDCDYQGLPYVARLQPAVCFVGGINAPKQITVTDNYGKAHKQLIKSGDDLRQDAVMQQFFQLVNSLLAADAAAARRGLRIATYKVAAFSGAAGLLQWLGNTVSLSNYLIASPQDPSRGAHARYARPEHVQPLAAQKSMQSLQAKETDKRKWVAHYARIANALPPVLRRFFVERYHEPALWLQKHQAFAKSVAVSSMAGYVIGLGDRHSSNILIDSRTAEVVQIDLGIAFEAGQQLPTPECVPFRLTRDIVDGLGVTGVEGVLRRCAESALGIMRRAQHAIITIVEVFVHDPLLHWQPTPAKVAKTRGARRTSGHASDHDDDPALHLPPEVNINAEVAVGRVQTKLKGLDFEQSEPLSVQGQVDLLLVRAMDPNKLGEMFHGWAAWL